MHFGIRVEKAGQSVIQQIWNDVISILVFLPFGLIVYLILIRAGVQNELSTLTMLVIIAFPPAIIRVFKKIRIRYSATKKFFITYDVFASLERTDWNLINPLDS